MGVTDLWWLRSSGTVGDTEKDCTGTGKIAVPVRLYSST